MSFVATGLGILSGGWNFVKGLPWQVWAALGAVAIVGLAYCAGGEAEADKRDAESAIADRDTLEDARKADEVAGRVVDQDLDRERERNENAKDAARSSDDPLRAGLNELRGDEGAE